MDSNHKKHNYKQIDVQRDSWLALVHSVRQMASLRLFPLFPRKPLSPFPSLLGRSLVTSIGTQTEHRVADLVKLLEKQLLHVVRIAAVDETDN